MSPLGPVLLLAACQTQAPAPPPAAPRNIVVVVMDTVRWDHTSLADAALDTTPMLAALAALPGATTFTRAYSPGAWSGPAYASLFTGRSALSHGVGFTRDSYAPEQTTLAELAAAYGYQTAGFASGPHLPPKLGCAQGFETYGHDLTAHSLAQQVDAALAWLDARTTPERPFLLFVQGYDAHYPYPSPTLMAGLRDPQPAQHHRSDRCAADRAGPAWSCAEPHQTAAQITARPPLLAHVVGHYDAAIRYADYSLGRLLAGLEDRGLLDTSILVAMSDHGEDLEGPRAFSHDWSCGEAVFHVPLVLRVPGSDALPAARWDGLVSTEDLLPTLADLIGAVPPAGITGHDLLPLTAEPDRIVTGASMMCYRARDADWILRGDREAGAMRWSLHRGDDAAPDVLAEQPAVAARLRAAVADWPEQLDTIQINQDPALQDPALRRALQEGGYWQRMEKAKP